MLTVKGADGEDRPSLLGYVTFGFYLLTPAILWMLGVPAAAFVTLVVVVGTMWRVGTELGKAEDERKENLP